MPIQHCYLAVETQEGQTYRLIPTIECRTEHAYSAIVAITHYLLKELPSIIPPVPTAVLEKLKAITTPVFNPLFQFWYELILKSVQEGLAQRHQNSFYIYLPLTYLPSNLFEQSPAFKLQEGIDLKQVPSSEKCSRIFQIPVVQRNKKSGFFLVSPLQQAVPVFSRFSSAAIMIGIFFNNQQWEIFDILKGNIPSTEHLKTFNTVIIPGSTASVLNLDQGTSQGLDNLITAYQASNTLKIVGVCYGHQLIAKRYGSELVRKAMRRDITAVMINKQVIQELPYLQPLKDPQYLLLSQLNEDFVQTVPAGFDLLAYSQACKVEALLSQNRRILTTQFHSEYLFDHLAVYQAQLKSLGAPTPDIQIPKEVIEGNNKYSTLFLEVIRGFIDA